MTDTTISDAVVFPEDDGTGVADGSEDYDSAGHFGLLSQHQGGTYVGNGLDFTNVDTTNETVDITTGHAFVEFSSVTVQSGSGTTYDTTLPDAIVMTIVLPSNVTLSLDTDATNDVYLATDPTTNDGAYLRHGSAVTEPTDPSVLLGTVNTSDGSTTRASDNASPTFDTVTSNSVSTDTASITGETIVKATRNTESASTSAGTHVNAFDAEVEDNLGEFNTSQQFVPQETGDYTILGAVDVFGGASGDTLEVRIWNTTDSTAKWRGRFPTDGDGQGFLPISFDGELSSGDAYEVQVTNFDSSFVVDDTHNITTIKRSVVDT